MKQVTIAGMGPGSAGCMTQEVCRAVKQADVLIGSERLIAPYTDQRTVKAVTAAEILRAVENEDGEHFTVLMSGDTGFYSGTKKLVEQLNGKYAYRILPGISSVIYFAAKIGVAWEQAQFVSLHGKKQPYLPVIMQNEYTFFLTQGNTAEICTRIAETGLGNVHVWIGENLSYQNEKIMHGSAKELTAYQAAGLSVMAVHNPKPGAFTGTGLPDDCFIRGSVPMTKREIRACVVSRLAPAKNACIYDIGAGTGSVTVELAMQALYGCVYAVERTEEGCSLIAQNAHKFGLDNIQVVHGSAAGVLEELPAPDAVFVGGSGGELEDIFKIILKKNPHVRIVITAVTLETVQEAVRLLEQNGFDTPQIVQIAVTEVKKRGQYHMLSANNPVFIIEGSSVR